ncbi:MAG TPA: aminoacyl-tRNA hydrolase [Myxococcales bacterium]|nr:aminoacyl-tRNA hydrolase [Myxococcales bacterium]
MSGLGLRLVVGLGNPGQRYVGTRHNVGFRIVEGFAARHGISLNAERWRALYGRGTVAGRPTVCLKPQTYMNSSGQSLALALDEFSEVDPVQDLIVVYDDLDLAFGRLRLRPSGSGGGHRGMESIIAAVGGPLFPRLRFGVGRPLTHPGEVVDFVLAPFVEAETDALVLRTELAVDALDAFLGEGIEPAMKRFNSSPDSAFPGGGSAEGD